MTRQPPPGGTRALASASGYHRWLTPARAVAGFVFVTALFVLPPVFAALFGFANSGPEAEVVTLPWALPFVLLVAALVLTALPRGRWSQRFAALVMACLALLWAELGFRVAVRSVYSEPAREHLAFVGEQVAQPAEHQYLGHPFLHYLGNPEVPGTNAMGFWDEEHELDKPAGVVRVACVGGSTTASGYPALLERRLEAEQGEHPRFEVLNFGVHGWTTLHSLVNLVVWGVDYQPDYVVVHHAHNDMVLLQVEQPCGDYSHGVHTYCYADPRPVELWFLSRSLLYRELWGRLRGGGQAAPPTLLARQTNLPSVDGVPGARCASRSEPSALFERHVSELVSLARTHGATVILTTMPNSDAHRNPHDADTSVANDIIRQIAVAGDPGVVLLDLDREISAALQPHFQDVVHLEEPGRQIKADHIGAAILHHLGSQATETASPPKVFVDD